MHVPQLLAHLEAMYSGFLEHSPAAAHFGHCAPRSTHGAEETAAAIPVDDFGAATALIGSAVVTAAGTAVVVEASLTGDAASANTRGVALMEAMSATTGSVAPFALPVNLLKPQKAAKVQKARSTRVPALERVADCGLLGVQTGSKDADERERRESVGVIGMFIVSTTDSRTAAAQLRRRIQTAH